MYPRIDIFAQGLRCSIDQTAEIHAADSSSNILYDEFFKHRANVIVVVLSVNWHSYSSSAMFEQAKKIVHQAAKKRAKIFFFFEDIFTLYYPDNVRGDIDYIDYDLRADSDIGVNELDVVKFIAENIPFSIFHCEKVPGEKLKRYPKYTIHYLDWYMAAFSATRWIGSYAKDYQFSSDFEKKITCLNNRKSQHRVMFTSFLGNWSNDILLSRNFAATQDDLDKSYIHVDALTNKVLSAGLLKLNAALKQGPIDGLANVNSSESFISSVRLSERSFCTLVTETRYLSAFPNFSEKTLKPILAHRPFLLAAPVGTLQLLRKLGFATFPELWDESYDGIDDHAARARAIMKICKSILNTPEQDLKRILATVKEKLEHNAAHARTLHSSIFHQCSAIK